MPAISHDRTYYLDGVLPIVLASLLWALGYLLRKTILAGISPLLLTLLSAAITCLGLGLWYRLKPALLFAAFRRHWAAYLSLSFFGVALGTSAMFIALDHLDLGVAALLGSIRPIFTILLGVLFLGERLERGRARFILLAVVSSYLVSTGDPLALAFSHSELIGFLAISVATVSWAATSVIGRHIALDDVAPETITFLRFFWGTIYFLPLLFLGQTLEIQFTFSAEVGATIVFSALVTSLIGFVSFYKGLKRVEAGTAALLELATPVFAVCLGLLFLGESLPLTRAAALPLFLYSVYRLSLR